MKCEIRRQEILNLLSQSAAPVSASTLSGEFGVSRQIIVKDIAKLREEGAEISALARGYVLENKGKELLGKLFK